MNIKSAIFLVCSLAISACALPYRGAALPVAYGGPQDWQQNGRYRETPPQAGSWTQQAQDPDKPLYGWDGGVVDSQPQGRVVQQERTRGVEPSPSSRTHIIELYQEVLEERDELVRKVENLNAALLKAEEDIQNKCGESDGFSSQVEALKLEQERLVTRNQELAARLTTAQIRRLEAEKLLLELRIHDHRAQNPDATEAAKGGGL